MSTNARPRAARKSAARRSVGAFEGAAALAVLLLAGSAVAQTGSDRGPSLEPQGLDLGGLTEAEAAAVKIKHRCIKLLEFCNAPENRESRHCQPVDPRCSAFQSPGN